MGRGTRKHDPYHQLPDPQPSDGLDSPAHASDAVGGWNVLYCRHSDRSADRDHLCLQAIFNLRPGRYVHLNAGVFSSNILYRCSVHRDLCGQFRLVPVSL
mgnify:CR=1 FL=1